MKVLLVLNDGLRVVVKLPGKKLQNEFNKYLSQGKVQEAAKLLKNKAQVEKPLHYGKAVPDEFRSLIKIME